MRVKKLKVNVPDDKDYKTASGGAITNFKNGTSFCIVPLTLLLNK